MGKIHSDKKTIQLSMILLFLALLVIYILLFSIKWDQFKDKLGNTTYTENQVITYESGDNTKDTKTESEKTIATILEERNNENNKANNEKHTNTWTTETKTTVNTWELDEYAALEENTTTQLDNQNDIYILSGTEKYFGPIKIIEKLGIKYQFALKDNKDIYYIYLGSYHYNFDELARLRSWNTYKMTEQAIIKNNLFGEEVTFINLPDYQNQTVIMLVKVKGVEWLLQIDYAIYYKSKEYLKTLFNY